MENRKKINRLFSDRLILELIDHLIKTQNKASIFNQIVALQEAIYALDTFLESHWDIQKSELYPFWKSIKSELSKLISNKDQIINYCFDIETYQRHELDLRNNIWVCEYSWDYFYYYKSCDLRLMRKLIFDKSHVEDTLLHHPAWFYYEIISELLDDLDDLTEDIQGYNANWVIQAICKYGAKHTISHLEKQITIAMNSYIQKKPLEDNFLSHHLEKVYTLCKQNIHVRISEFDRIIDKKTIKLMEKLI